LPAVSTLDFAKGVCHQKRLLQHATMPKPTQLPTEAVTQAVDAVPVEDCWRSWPAVGPLESEAEELTKAGFNTLASWISSIVDAEGHVPPVAASSSDHKIKDADFDFCILCPFCCGECSVGNTKSSSASWQCDVCCSIILTCNPRLSAGASDEATLTPAEGAARTEGVPMVDSVGPAGDFSGAVRPEAMEGQLVNTDIQVCNRPYIFYSIRSNTKMQYFCSRHSYLQAIIPVCNSLIVLPPRILLREM
jgi:hypothetical protein